ncbi:hypothetical protein FE257_003844 [Aspergillus nanangensis]|uniref:Myb-like domain-containing protein n=1 Tax=Aspergillus nanangensis TaxID=2582783 RepID=A0AAD4CCF4_ASPNN|nr:hypothetical protein FE257_003844 [Aspergillus nanangensis]
MITGGRGSPRVRGSTVDQDRRHPSRMPDGLACHRPRPSRPEGRRRGTDHSNPPSRSGARSPPAAGPSHPTGAVATAASIFGLTSGDGLSHSRDSSVIAMGGSASLSGDLIELYRLGREEHEEIERLTNTVVFEPPTATHHRRGSRNRKWSQAEEKRLQERMHKYQNNWGLILEADRDHPDGSLLHHRNNVSIKDKARIIKKQGNRPMSAWMNRITLGPRQLAEVAVYHARVAQLHDYPERVPTAFSATAADGRIHRT